MDRITRALGLFGLPIMLMLAAGKGMSLLYAMVHEDGLVSAATSELLALGWAMLLGMLIWGVVLLGRNLMAELGASRKTGNVWVTEKVG